MGGRHRVGRPRKIFSQDHVQRPRGDHIVYVLRGVLWIRNHDSRYDLNGEETSKVNIGGKTLMRTLSQNPVKVHI